MHSNALSRTVLFSFQPHLYIIFKILQDTTVHIRRIYMTNYTCSQDTTGCMVDSFLDHPENASFLCISTFYGGIDTKSLCVCCHFKYFNFHSSHRLPFGNIVTIAMSCRECIAANVFGFVTLYKNLLSLNYDRNNIDLFVLKYIAKLFS